MSENRLKQGLPLPKTPLGCIIRGLCSCYLTLHFDYLYSVYCKWLKFFFGSKIFQTV